MNDLFIAFSAILMMVSPCLLARAICISDRRAKAARYAALMAQAHKVSSYRVSGARLRRMSGAVR